MHTAAEKNFVGVDIADAGNQFLVEQDRFYGATTLTEYLFEFRKIDIERVRSESAPFYKLADIFQQSDLTKHALIIESEPATFLEDEKHSGMPVPRSAGGFGRRGFLFAFEIAQEASHTEVQSQPEVVIGTHKQMFAMAATGLEAVPFQLLRQLTFGNAFQNVCVSHIDRPDPLMQGRRIEVSPERLNIGQLWHRDLCELLEVFFQRNRVVILTVFSGEEQCERGFSNTGAR